MSIDTMAIVQASAQRLFPNLGLDQVLAELLLESAIMNASRTAFICVTLCPFGDVQRSEYRYPF